jgi:hypothetical protein
VTATLVQGAGAGVEPAHPPLSPTAGPATRRRWLRIGTALLAVGAVVWFAGRELPSWSVLAAALGRVDLPLLGVAAVLATFSLWLFARQQQVLFAGFGVRLPVAPVVGITYSRSAMSMTFPAGSVASAVFAVEQFRRFGAGRSTAAAVMVLSGVVSVVGLGCLYAVGAVATWVFPRPWQVVAAVVIALCSMYVVVALAHRRVLPTRQPRVTPPLPTRPLGRGPRLPAGHLRRVRRRPAGRADRRGLPRHPTRPPDPAQPGRDRTDRDQSRRRPDAARHRRRHSRGRHPRLPPAVLLAGDSHRARHLGRTDPPAEHQTGHRGCGVGISSHSGWNSRCSDIPRWRESCSS